MAVYKNSLPIVRDGLVLHLDAANMKSYPKSGTDWNNLSNNIYKSGSIINGAVYDINAGGSIRMDGVNDYIEITSGSGINVSNRFTFQCWVNFNSIGGGNFPWQRETLIANSYTYAAGKGFQIAA